MGKASPLMASFSLLFIGTKHRANHLLDLKKKICQIWATVAMDAPFPKEDKADILTDELSPLSDGIAPTSMIRMHSRTAFHGVAKRFWASSSKISNGRVHYEHGDAAHYAGNGGAILSAGAAGMISCDSAARTTSACRLRGKRNRRFVTYGWRSDRARGSAC